MPRIAFLGAGTMGSAMVPNLLKGGYDVTVYNRTLERARPLECLGAKLAETPREAVDGVEAIISMVLDDAEGRPHTNPPPCWPYDPSVEGRFALYVASMDQLLNPDRRIPKMSVLDREIVIDIAPKVALLDRELGLTLTIPAGFPAVAVNSLRFKDLIQDLVLVGRDPAKLDAKYADLLTAPRRDALREGLLAIRAELLDTASLSGIELVLGREEAVVGRVQDLTLQVGNGFVQRYYSNVLERVENAGHRFGENLSQREKQALIAFVATL